jgi:hypothetical protein
VERALGKQSVGLALARVGVRAATKIFFVKNLVNDGVQMYSECGLVEAGVFTGRDPVETTP